MHSMMKNANPPSSKRTLVLFPSDFQAFNPCLMHYAMDLFPSSQTLKTDDREQKKGLQKKFFE